MTEENILKCIDRLSAVEQSDKAAHKRIKVMEAKVDNMYELVASVKEIATEMKAMREDVNKIDVRVNTLEEKPARKWEQIVSLIITGVTTAILGFLLAKFGL